MTTPFPAATQIGPIGSVLDTFRQVQETFGITGPGILSWFASLVVFVLAGWLLVRLVWFLFKLISKTTSK